ncbi:MAG: sulfur carrier protein ThiS [Mariprofundaceae bacterium]
MNIHLNGESKIIHAATISELIQEIGLQSRLVAVERNLEVVPKSLYGEVSLEDGDRIEIVHMIGGG